VDNRWDKVPVWIDGVPYWMIDEKEAAVTQKVGHSGDLPEPTLERIATALEGIRRELGVIRRDLGTLATRSQHVPQLGPPRRTPPGSPPALPRQS
jgi:hypothetical protein